MHLAHLGDSVHHHRRHHHLLLYVIDRHPAPECIDDNIIAHLHEADPHYAILALLLLFLFPDLVHLYIDTIHSHLNDLTVEQPLKNKQKDRKEQMEIFFLSLFFFLLLLHFFTLLNSIYNATHSSISFHL